MINRNPALEELHQQQCQECEDRDMFTGICFTALVLRTDAGLALARDRMKEFRYIKDKFMQHIKKGS